MAACFNTDNADECRRLVEEAAKTAQGALQVFRTQCCVVASLTPPVNPAVRLLRTSVSCVVRTLFSYFICFSDQAHVWASGRARTGRSGR
jgi:hypothetical protein